MTTQTRYFALQGGLDVVTPAIRVGSGRAIACLNYEPHPRGYARVDGYERYDGRPRPSQASYWVLPFDQGTVAIAAGDTVTGLTSGHSGIAVVNGVVASGTYGGGNAAGTLVLRECTGVFQDNEELRVLGVTRARANGTAVQRGAANDTDDANWYNLAIEQRRTVIGAVPGSGPVRGVWVYNGNVYAVRDNGGGTAGVLHKATASGWAAQALGRQLTFTAGTVAFVEGQTLTGGTSGATGVIKRVVVESGDWTTNNAAGRIIFATVTGAFQNAETITSTPGSATTVGVDAAITLPPGGRYSFANHNFFGASNLRRMYGANGVGQAFEYDGTVFVPLRTGMADDRPTLVAVHRNHLFLAFRGGSVQHSAVGDPYVWDVVLGAGELGLGDEVTMLVAVPQGPLVIMGESQYAILYGFDSESWDLQTRADDSGAVAWTGQVIGAPIYLDAIGLRSMVPTDAFGDFQIGSITRLVEPVFAAKRKAGITAVASIRVRAKDQYRLYWSDGTGMTVYFGRQPTEAMPFNLGWAPSCTASGKDASGVERLFAGAATGFVYELDSGTSFDGADVEAFIRLPFNHVGSPAQEKRWQKASLEVDAGPRTALGLTAEYSYADPDQPPANEQQFDVRGSGGFWNEMVWDQFYWSSPVEGQADVPIDGLGRTMSLTVISKAATEPVHVLHGLVVHFSYRRLAR